MNQREASSFILAFEDDASGTFADHSLNMILLCRDFIVNPEYMCRFYILMKRRREGEGSSWFWHLRTMLSILDRLDTLPWSSVLSGVDYTSQFPSSRFVRSYSTWLLLSLIPHQKCVIFGVLYLFLEDSKRLCCSCPHRFCLPHILYPCVIRRRWILKPLLFRA